MWKGIREMKACAYDNKFLDSIHKDIPQQILIISINITKVKTVNGGYKSYIGIIRLKVAKKTKTTSM